jgi:Zn-finger nucleic acid-binding protein
VVFRENVLTCARCGTPSLELVRTLGHSFQRCTTCLGIWIELAQLACMFTDMGARARPILSEALQGRGGHARRCPACEEPMEAAALLGMEVEMCGHHGIWFDNHELEDVLRRAAAG